MLLTEPDVDGVTSLAGPLLFTIPSVPGGTADAIFQWTGKDLGWDMYGHTIPTDARDSIGQFFDDHPFGTTPSPYAGGLPGGFPGYCSL